MAIARAEWHSSPRTSPSWPPTSRRWKKEWAKYEPKEVDITIAVDDTLCKGVESWALVWAAAGQPGLLKPAAHDRDFSRQPEALIRNGPPQGVPVQTRNCEGHSQLFRAFGFYKDDHTDVRILGAIARILPNCSVSSRSKRRSWTSGTMSSRPHLRGNPTSRTTSLTVQAQPGQSEEPYRFDFP